MNYLQKMLLPLRYARRDFRAGLKGFYIFLACLTLGVASIAGIQSLSHGLVESLRHDGRYILGGDIALRTMYEPAPSDQIKFLHDKMGPITIVMETRAMARNEIGDRAGLVELKAVDPFYPLYGKLEIVDENGKALQTPMQDLILPPVVNGKGTEEWGALVEKEVLSRLNVHIGDWIGVGQQKFQVRGILSKEPDRIGSMQFSIAPRVMISGYTFATTGLSRLGGQVYYDHKVLLPYVKTFDDLAAARKKVADAFPDAKWKGRDFLTAAPRLERMIKRLTLFFTLIGLATLLIGGVGVSNAARAFLDSRRADIATLKCLGASGRLAFYIYLLQILLLATIGILLGLGLGIAGSQAAGALLTAKLALTDKVSVYPNALALAAAFGYLTTLCFSLWPLGRAVRTSPAELFRDTVSPSSKRPTLKVMLSILIFAQILALCAIESATDKMLVLLFVGFSFLSFAVFFAYAFALKAGLKRLRVFRRPEMRLAAANLHRPGNSTSSIILSLGLGLTVLVAVALVQNNFLRVIRDDISVDAPSFFFLDIEPGQRDAFTQRVSAEPSAHALKLLPSMRGRVVAVNGKKAEEALVDPNESWVINSDRGITYTADLPDYSRVVSGEWWPKDYSGPPAVSIASNVSRAFGIGVGDDITVNILGTDVTAKVMNVREINWGSFTMNFAITFAPGLLDKIPSNALATVIIAPDREEALQTSVATKFPNITVVRVRDALQAAQTMVKAVGQGVAISAGVTLVSGILVLAGAIAASRRRHLYDAIVLKVLGASRKRILATFLLEYAMLGIAAVMIACLLGTAAAYGLQKRIMDIGWGFSWTAVIGACALCLFITMVAGFFGTWQALRQKPAPYLRNQ